MTNRHRIWVEHAGGRIALARRGDAEAGKPPALLVHGTGFVAEVWDEVARGLARRHTVYGIRPPRPRQPATSLHPIGITSSISHRMACAVVETLGLADIFGVGHSAGATDLLLAAHLMPGRFSRLFVMEPTIMDPRARSDGGLSDKAAASVQGTLRRTARIRQRRHGIQPLSRGTGVRGLVGRRPAGLHPARLRDAARRPGAAAVPAGNRSGDAAADLRGDGAGLRRRRTRQSLRLAHRDRLPGARRHRRNFVGRLQGDGREGGRADPGRERVDVRRRRPLRGAGSAAQLLQALEAFEAQTR